MTSSPSSPPHSSTVTSATSASAAVPSASSPSLMCYGIYSAPSLASSPRATSRRPFLSSYRALCRFLLSARPLLGVWVHDNPNQGNFVFVMLGFLSLIACRVIPQKVGPTGFNGDPLLRAPVFEISAESDGSMAFFLHGSENNSDYLYPGFVNSIHPHCSLLRLEVEPRPSRRSCNLLCRPESAIRRCNSDSDLPSCNSSISPSCSAVPFSCLKYGDQVNLLLLVANQVRLKVPGSLSCSPFFPHQSSIDTEDSDLGLFCGTQGASSPDS
ncbi:F-box-like protein [Cinnamomum micranthum f. kanehirae]|uniref:F-box-like protein n=1 Tax=Cinnamomum micranthum f. kanehirae TaxID=337451 RepID=A0A3S3NBG5_9MAGN|nr:F-box-like protein [Cinnamomum micranthum f. kanehirae]